MPEFPLLVEGKAELPFIEKDIAQAHCAKRPTTEIKMDDVRDIIDDLEGNSGLHQTRR